MRINRLATYGLAYCFFSILLVTLIESYSINTTAMPESKSSLLYRFQRQGDLEALIAYGQSLGQREARLRAAVTLLRPVFESLSCGENPGYERLDRDRLLEQRQEIVFIVRCMTESETADLKTAGLHIMGILNLEPFLQDLQKALASAHTWERVEAIRALARMNHPQVRTILESVTAHPDPITRQAARKVLGLSPPL